MTTIRLLISLGAVGVLAGCVGSMPVLGDAGAKTAATGSAGGSSSHNANAQLERCDASLGTLAVIEDQSQPWYGQLRSHNLESTVPLIRLLVQQSNCFVVVERGRAMSQMQQERGLADSGELRQGSNFQRGQMVAADFSMNPSITFNQKDAGGIGGTLSRVSSSLGVLGSLAGGVKFQEASTMLTLTDNRSGVQLAAAEGSSSNTDFNIMGALAGSRTGGNLGGYTNTAQGKVIAAAFADSYNQLVRSVKSYQAQSVQGGLGTGGRLGVQGGR